MKRTNRFGALTLAATTALSVLSGPAGASPGDGQRTHTHATRHGAPAPSATTVATFDPALGPEGIAITPDGSIYVSTSTKGEIWQVLPDGSTRVEAVLDAQVAAGAFGVLGVDNDRDGHLYAMVASGNPDTIGVWTWTPGGTPTRMAGSEKMSFPNAAFITDDGTVYVTDSLTGEIWRASGRTDTLRRWKSDPLLLGTGKILGNPAVPVGANGIVEQDDVVYVVNTEQSSIVAVAVNADGSAGAARVWTRDDRLFGIDGLAIGPDGVLYVAVNQLSTVYRVAWDTSLTLLADASDGIDYTSDLAFGHGRYERSVFAVNFSIGELFGVTGLAGPSVVRVDHAAPPVHAGPHHG